MDDDKKQLIHDTLYNYCHEFLNVQEITHAANEIIKEPTEDKIIEMANYLDSFDTIRLGQPTMMPTGTVRGLESNNVRFAMSEIRKIING